MWASMFCNGNPQGKMPQDIVKLYFDDWDCEDDVPEMSEEEKKQLQADMDAWQDIMRKAETQQ